MRCKALGIFTDVRFSREGRHGVSFDLSFCIRKNLMSALAR